MSAAHDFGFQGFSEAFEVKLHRNIDEFSHILVDDDEVEPEDYRFFLLLRKFD